MTTPRPWPNNARAARDRAAEEMVVTMRILDQLLRRVENGQFTRAGLERSILYAYKHSQTAVRHLESVGAQTVPE